MSNPFPMSLFRSEQIYEVVEQFDVVRPKGPTGIIKAERLTPDSAAVVFLWDKFYVLYTDDFIDSLEAAQQVVEEWALGKVANFIKPKTPLILEDIIGNGQYSEEVKAKVAAVLPYLANDGSNLALLAEVELPKNAPSYWSH